jgi:hypothetical protein
LNDVHVQFCGAGDKRRPDAASQEHASSRFNTALLQSLWAERLPDIGLEKRFALLDNSGEFL